MDWKKIASQLLADGWTQAELARECDCSQPSISDIANGITSEPKASIALKLLELQSAKQPRERVRARA